MVEAGEVMEAADRTHQMALAAEVAEVAEVVAWKESGMVESAAEARGPATAPVADEVMDARAACTEGRSGEEAQRARVVKRTQPPPGSLWLGELAGMAAKAAAAARDAAASSLRQFGSAALHLLATNLVRCCLAPRKPS